MDALWQMLSNIKMFNSLYKGLVTLVAVSSGCAANIRYASIPDLPDCSVTFKVEAIGNPDYIILPIGCLQESTLNGGREVILALEKSKYRL